ncbi:MAG: CDP-diacylglycerol--serine O-phosphatidyltransferase [Acidobacteria bacterium]|nr:CDP-diacylglycerol--serine O-phosphatidyltransferase [Acidobacteriota bacterium]
MMNAPESPQVGGRRSRSMFIIPTLFTSANIFCGFYAAVASLKGYQVLGADLAESTRYFNHASLAIGWAVLFDSLDGTIARMTKATSDFGIELDSLADVLSFGIAPAILIYAWGCGMAAPGLGVDMGELAWAVSFMFLVCGAYRLARFNVQSHRLMPSTKKERKHFIGMPIPAAAGLIAAVVHFLPQPLTTLRGRVFHLFGEPVVMDAGVWSLGLLVLAVTLSILMVSTVRYVSFKEAASFHVSARRSVLYLSLLVCGIYFYSRWVLLLIASTYALQPILAKAFHILKSPHGGSAAMEAASKT